MSRPALSRPTDPSPSRRRASALGIGLLTAGLLALGAGPAAAHNTLISTDPADGSTVPTAPDAVTLTFNEPAIALGTQIQVTGPDGSELAAGEPQLADTSVVQPLVDDRPAGAYQVVWRVTSADGHPIEGEFSFEATDAAGSDDVEAPPADDPITGPDDEPGDGTTSPEPDAEAPGTDDTTADEVSGEEAQADATDESDDGGLPGWLVPVGIVALVAAITAAITLAVRARRE